MREQYMRCGEGFLICYSVTDRQSFEEVDQYRDLIQRTRATEDMPIVLIGNKFDLQMQRKVGTYYYSAFQEKFQTTRNYLSI